MACRRIVKLRRGLLLWPLVGPTRATARRASVSSSDGSNACASQPLLLPRLVTLTPNQEPGRPRRPRRPLVLRQRPLNASGVGGRPIMTLVMPSRQLHPAEAYHQGYFRNSPGQGAARRSSPEGGQHPQAAAEGAAHYAGSLRARERVPQFADELPAVRDGLL